MLSRGRVVLLGQERLRNCSRSQIGKGNHNHTSQTSSPDMSRLQAAEGLSVALAALQWVQDQWRHCRAHPLPVRLRTMCHTLALHRSQKMGTQIPTQVQTLFIDQQARISGLLQTPQTSLPNRQLPSSHIHPRTRGTQQRLLQQKAEFAAYVWAALVREAHGNRAVSASPAYMAVAATLVAVPTAIAVVKFALTGQRAWVRAHELVIRAIQSRCTHPLLTLSHINCNIPCSSPLLPSRSQEDQLAIPNVDSKPAGPTYMMSWCTGAMYCL